MGALEKIRGCKRKTFTVGVDIEGEEVEFEFKNPRQAAQQEMMSTLPASFLDWAMKNKDSLEKDSDKDLAVKIPEGVNAGDMLRMQNFMVEWCLKNEVVKPEGFTIEDADNIINEWPEKERMQLYSGINENLERLAKESEQAAKNLKKTR